MKKIVALVFIKICFVMVLFVGILAVPVSFAMDTQDTFYGEIYDTDSDISMVTVKYVEEGEAGSFEERNCFVNSETKILRKGNEIDMNQLFPGDKVYVELGMSREGLEVTVLIKVVDSLRE